MHLTYQARPETLRLSVVVALSYGLEKPSGVFVLLPSEIVNAVTTDTIKTKKNNMATLKKSKLDALIIHLKAGGDEDLETVASVTDVDIEDEDTLTAYFRKAKKDLAVADAPAPTEISYQLRDDSGVLRDLEVLRQKDGNVILQLPVFRDIVTIFIKGVEHSVDLEELRKLDQTSLHLGVRVSEMLTAGELSKG